MLNNEIGKSAPAAVEEAELMRQLALNLRWLRGIYDLPQRALAEYLHVDRSTYCYYETGTSHPPVITLKKIANYYRLGMDDLVNEELRILSF